MFDRIVRLEANGLHGRFDVELDFDPKVNVIYGKNGTGKTTVLHILTNFLNGELARFAHLEFENILITGVSGEEAHLARYEKSEEDVYFLRLRIPSKGIDKEVQVSDLLKRPRHPEERRFVEQENPFEEEISELGLPDATYFPAYRTMIEAWASASLSEDSRGMTSSIRARERELLSHRYVMGTDQRFREKLTLLARELFGEFAPRVDYLSPQEIEMSLSLRVQETALSVLGKDREISLATFLATFSALESKTPVKETPEQLLGQIRDSLESLERSRLGAPTAVTSTDIYRELRDIVPNLSGVDIPEAASGVLVVYRDALKQRVRFQEESLTPLLAYVDAVNEFLEGKMLQIDFEQPRYSTNTVSIKFPDDTIESLRILSSGERQIVSMLFAASEQSKRGIVLVDEPELSLHIDWQRKLLPKMVKQLGDSQVIVSTHSPSIGADFDEGVRVLTVRDRGDSKHGAEHGRQLIQLKPLEEA